MNTAQLHASKRQLLNKYLQARAAGLCGSSVMPPVRLGKCVAPLTPVQEGIWWNAQKRDVPPFYNEEITIHRSGPLDPAILERCMVEIIRRHEAWRTTFELRNGSPVQVVHAPPTTFPFDVIDLRALPESEREKHADKLASSEVLRDFDLARGPLLRATLVRVGDEQYRYYLAVHQILIDGISAYHIFLPELAALYQAFSQGLPSPLPELPIQCTDFAIWQRNWFRGATAERQLAYWRDHLSGALPTLQWPDVARPPKRTFRGAFRNFQLPHRLSRALNDFSHRNAITLFITLLTGFFLLLHRYSGQLDLIVGTVSPSGRKWSETQSLLGYFLNPVPLRVRLFDNPTLREILSRVQRASVGALSSDDVPFETLVEVLNPKTETSRNPFFTVAASLEPSMPLVDPSWNLTPMDIANGGGRWDMYLVWDDRPAGIIGRVQFNPDLFTDDMIDAFLSDQETMLNKLVSSNQERLADLSF